MRVLVVGGAGEMGRQASRTLATMEAVDSIIVADLHVRAAQTVAADIRSDRCAHATAEAVGVDVTRCNDLRALMECADIVVNTVGPFYRFGVDILTAAIDTGKDYVDICDDPDPTLTMLELDDGPHILGYGTPVAIDAITTAINQGAVNALGNVHEIELAEVIAEAFGGDTRVVLSNSGTESVIMALRIARAHTGKQRVAKFEGHYHGFSDQGMVSSWFRYSGAAQTPNPISNSAGAQEALVKDTLVLQYGAERSLHRIVEHAGELAAVILEPMPAVQAGYNAEFLAALVDTCRRHNVLVIFDEVVSGFRVAFGGAQTLAGVRPDLTCLGKIIGGGLPGGAVAGRRDVIETARTSNDPFIDLETRAFVGGTMSGNSITAAAGTAVLTHLRDNPQIYDDLNTKTDYLKERLEKAAAEVGVPTQVKGARSVFSISFDYARPTLVRDQMAGTNVKATLALSYYMRSHGVYLPELHTMLLNDAHSIDDLDIVADAFAASLSEMDSEGFFVH